MPLIVATGLLALQLAASTHPVPQASAQAQARIDAQPGAGAPRSAPVQPPVPPPPPLPANWSDAPLPGKAAIRAAARHVLQEEAQAINPRRDEANTLRGDRYDDFAARFAYARVPDCLRPDGLRHQPTSIFTGLLALPFVAIAKAKGRCN